MRSLSLTLATACILIPSCFAQQTASPKTQNQKKSPAAVSTIEPAENTAAKPDNPAEQRPVSPPANADRDRDNKEEHFDMTEVPPVVTHHQVTVDGKALKYTATTGRLPIKRGDGKIEAEMFYVAYTLDGQDAAKRPLTFAFNGGRDRPRSGCTWERLGHGASCCSPMDLCRPRPTVWKTIPTRCSIRVTWY